MKLTKTSVTKLLESAGAAPASGIQIHWADDLGGFGLRVYPSGAAAYVVDYRLKGSRRKRRVVIGKVNELTPHMARERCLEIKAAARQGVDLDQDLRAEAKRRDAEAHRKASAMTVGQAVTAYLEAFETTPSKRSGQRPASSTLRQEGVWLHRVAARHGSTALEELTAANVEAILEATPRSSQRNVFGAIARWNRWARLQGATSASPLEHSDPPARPASRDRTPSPGEVRVILEAADELMACGRWRQSQRDAIWLIALTAQRRGEVAAMGWEDVDFATAEWRQPAMKNKTSKAHVAPLGPHALEILKRRWETAKRPRTGLVAPGAKYGGRMDSNFGDLVQALREKTGIEFRLHDFRRSAVSAMAERGVDFAVADGILNHAASQSRAGMLGVYQHAELKPAKRRAMEIWEAALFPQTAEVIALRAR